MKFLGNILWLIFGGLAIALEYLLASLILMITIFGIPFGVQTLKLGIYALWPFNSKIKDRPDPEGCITIPMTVIWFIFGGFWIIITHFVLGFLLFITIVGIPFGQKHFNMARLALTPFEKEVVPDDTI